MRATSPLIILILALLATAFKVAMVYQVSPTGFTAEENVGWYFSDEKEYFACAENTATEGRHYFDSGGIEKTNFRMPGMSVVYVPLRFILSPSQALFMHGIFQLLLSVLAALLMADMAYRITRSRLVFYFAFLALSVTGHINYYLPFFITESLAISLTMILFYLVYRYHKEYRPLWGWLAGAALTWLVFLKPYMGIVLPLFGLFLLIRSLQDGTSVIKTLLPFILPFMLIDGAWTARNKIVADTWQPFQSSLDWYKSNPGVAARMSFVKDFGLPTEYWLPGLEHTWFMDETFPRPNDSVFAGRIFVGNYNLDSLKQARHHLLKSEELTGDQAEFHGLSAARILNGMRQVLKEEHPLEYHLWNRLRLIPRFVDQPLGYPNLKTANYPINVGYVLLDSAAYYSIMALFVLSILAFLIRMKPDDSWYWMAFFIPAFFLLFFTGLLRTNELRFFNIAVPFIICCGALGLNRITELGFRTKLIAVSTALLFVGALTYNSLITNINW